MTGPFQNALAYDEIAVEAVIPAPKGSRAGGYLKLERRVGDFATAGVAVALEQSGGSITRAGIALTGVGGSTIDAADAAQALVGGAARRRAASRRPPTSRRRPPSRAPTTAAARRTSGTSCARSSCASSTASPSRQRGQPDMTSLFEEISPDAAERRPRPAGDAHASTASGAPPTSSRGCCSPTCCARASS